MQTEMWILGWSCFVVILAVLRARRRRLEWRNQPGLSVVPPCDPHFNGTPPGTKDSGAPKKRSGSAEDTVTDRPESDLTPAVHMVPPDVAEFRIPDFRPHLDICEVDLRYPDIDFVHWRAPDMAAMMFTDGDEHLTVFFQGLDVVPFDGVYVRFDHPRKGPQTFLLSELLDVGESEISQEDAANRLDVNRASAQGHLGQGGPREFHNFDTSKECIEVFVPEDRLATTAISISSTPDGSDALVLVDGQVAAILHDAIDAGPRNVKLVAVDQTAAA